MILLFINITLSEINITEKRRKKDRKEDNTVK